MTVVMGPVLLLLASILLGAVLLLAAFGIVLWLTRRRHLALGESEGGVWNDDATDIADRDGTSVVVPGK